MNLTFLHVGIPLLDELADRSGLPMLHARHSAEKTLFIKILVHRLFVRLIGDSLCADRETGNGPV